jgi:hypothetical protein
MRHLELVLEAFDPARNDAPAAGGKIWFRYLASPRKKTRSIAAVSSLTRIL